MKYYIANGDRYLTVATDKEIVINGAVSYAKQFKKSTAEITLSQFSAAHPEYGIQKISDNQNGKNYVITTATRFVGNTGVVNCISQAHVFDTAADANGYIQGHPEVAGWIIINEALRPVNVYGDAKIQRLNKIKINLATSVEKVKRKRISTTIRQMVFNRDGGVCQICGKPVSITEFTVDHIIPAKRGGTNELSNYRCVCGRCNKWKSDRLDSEAITMMENVCGNYIYKHPNSESAKKMIRAMVRGIIYNMDYSDTN